MERLSFDLDSEALLTISEMLLSMLMTESMPMERRPMKILS
jgi:hypothetical protein